MRKVPVALARRSTSRTRAATQGFSAAVKIPHVCHDPAMDKRGATINAGPARVMQRNGRVGFSTRPGFASQFRIPGAMLCKIGTSHPRGCRSRELPCSFCALRLAACGCRLKYSVLVVCRLGTAGRGCRPYSWGPNTSHRRRT